MRVRQLTALIFLLSLICGVTGPPSLAQQLVARTSKAERSAEVFGSANSSTLLARRRGRRTGFSLMPSNRYVTGHIFARTTASFLPAVHGSGTVGKISMWTTTGPSGDSILGDSIITQLGGNIGIGTDSPTSKLSVQGMIETTMGGYKFPDGTVQTTAGLTSIFHDLTLEGDGTSASPLRVAVPLVLQAIGAPGSNGSIVNASNFGIGGFGMRAAGGAGGVGLIASAIASTTTSVGIGVDAFGGRGSLESDDGGIGVRAFGGFSSSGTGGVGVRAIGGRSESGTQSGTAVEATGAPSFTNAGGSYFGGHGVQAKGGNSTSTVGANTTGGHGVVATGGDSNTDFFGDSFGGHGVVATGGNSSTLSGRLGGSGVVATGGNPFGKGVTATGGLGGHDGADSFADDPTSAGVFATGGATTGLRFGGIGVFAKGGPASGSDKISGTGLWAEPGNFDDGATLGAAAFLNGKVFTGELLVNGDLTVSAGSFTVRGGTKNFKIDHPLDPENKYLLHASVESSEVLNIYSGNVVTNANGVAVVTLPDWFEALNTDLRYQLTVIGTFAQAIVAEKVKHNRFVIKTNAPNVEVSWQVTGVRSDAAMLKHPFRAEQAKPEPDRGTYLNPEAFGQSVEKGVEWVRSPHLMRRIRNSEKAQKAKQD